MSSQSLCEHPERSQTLSDISKWKDRQVIYTAPLFTKQPIVKGRVYTFDF